MKKHLLFSSLGALVPSLALAQKWDAPVENNEIAYASVFAGNFSLLLSIVIGLIATFLVWRAARKLGGGLFGLVLNYVSIGMLLVVLGTSASVLSPWFEDLWIDVVSTACFALGYIFMVVGGRRLFKGIINT
jgi:hypothetical protein